MPAPKGRAAPAPKPVYALVGADVFLQMQRLQSLLASLPQDMQRIDLDGERAELADVLDELRSFAMFGGRKLVVLRNADEFISRFRPQLEEFLGHPPDSAVLVLRVNSLPGNQRIAKLIAKVGQVEPCAPPRDPVRWAVDHAAAAHRLRLEPDAAAALVELIGNDPGKLDGELAKLALQAGSGRIDRALIESTVAFQRDQEMWDMTNELAAGNVAAALDRWRHLVQLDPSAEFRAVTWLAMWLQDVAAVLAAGRSGRMPNIAWKYKDRWAQFQKTALSLGEAGLARALDLLAEVDKHSKSGLGDAVTNIQRFILSAAPPSATVSPTS